MTSPWLDLTRAICDPAKSPADAERALSAVTTDLNRARLAKAERDAADQIARMARSEADAKAKRLHIIGGTDVEGDR